MPSRTASRARSVADGGSERASSDAATLRCGPRYWFLAALRRSSYGSGASTWVQAASSIRVRSGQLT